MADAAAAHRRVIADLIADLIATHERYPNNFATAAREKVLEAYLRGLRKRQAQPWAAERPTPVVHVDDTRSGSRTRRR